MTDQSESQQAAALVETPASDAPEVAEVEQEATSTGASVDLDIPTFGKDVEKINTNKDDEEIAEQWEELHISEKSNQVAVSTADVLKKDAQEALATIQKIAERTIEE